MQKKTWKPGTNRHAIAQEANSGKTRRQAFQALRPMVEAGILVLKRNPTENEKAQGQVNRIPLTLRYQLLALRNEISRVYAILGIVDIDPRFEVEIEAEIHSQSSTSSVEIPAAMEESVSSENVEEIA